MNAKDIKVYIEGEGSSMILLHGWGLDHSMMMPIFDYYKKAYRVCVFDLPGFKENADIDKGLTISDYCFFLEEIIELYHLENPIVIAHSFGARIAFAFAAKNPCAFLILTGAAGIKKPRNIKYYMKVFAYKVGKRLNMARRMGSVDYQNASDIMKKTLIYAVNYDSSKDIVKIQCPILLVWGENDEATPLWMANKMKRLNENISLVVLKEEDHFAYYHKMPLFLRICDQALQREV